VLCSLSSPANCHEQTVTTSDFADVSMQSCLMGAPQLAERMKQHPAERLAAWRCVIGKQDGRGVYGGKQLSSREFAANPIGVFFDPDSACDAQKAAANESLRVSVEKRGFVIVRGTMHECGYALSARRLQTYPVQKAA